MRLFGLLIGLFLALPLAAQVYVVPSGSGDGSSWTSALGNVKSALATGNADVRVAVGSYELEGELTVGAGQVLSGGWIPATGMCGENGAKRTVLKATGRSRVATIAGTLRGFTVTGGMVVDGKGGGLYVKTGGVVENCIITGNRAGTYYPRVGDAYCKGGTFLRKEEITVANASEIVGVVFWINPDTTAGAGQRGWIVALKEKVGKWLVGNTDKIYESMEEALQDSAGYGHTLAAMANGAVVDQLPGYCHNYNEGGVTGWYMPALRQVLVMLGEKEVIERTFAEIRKYGGTVPMFSDMFSYMSSTESKEGANNPFGIQVGYTLMSGIIYCARSRTTNYLTRPVLSF